jgi:signal transduction histidine kinase
LRNLIEDMTNLRYLHLGKADLVTEKVPVSALIQAAQNDVQSLLDAKGHQFIVDKTGGDALVNVDRMKIGMALTNILNNAVKFTNSGGQIAITLDCRPHEVWIKITITE